MHTQMEEMVRRYVELQQSRSTAEQDKQKLADELSQIKTRYNLSVRQLAFVKDDLLQREAELQSERERVLSTEQQIVAIKGDYVDLEEKYGQLVRPARSTVGRKVVEVRYTKASGINLYQIREAGEAEYRSVNLAQLHTILGAAKDADPNNLYTRIIIPDNSGLSYNDAWIFTNDILNRYDYYYQ